MGIAWMQCKGLNYCIHLLMCRCATLRARQPIAQPVREKIKLRTLRESGLLTCLSEGISTRMGLWVEPGFPPCSYPRHYSLMHLTESPFRPRGGLRHTAHKGKLLAH